MAKRNERGARAAGFAGIAPAFRGKVRDVYDLGDRLIIVASDRISAYDSVLPTAIPGKGIVLNMMSAAWTGWLSGVPNHLISTKVEDYPEPFNGLAKELGGRSMLVHKARRIDLECVVRGYLAGSGWKEYQDSGTVCGIALPPGLAMADRLDEPIFTPSTKADAGHDRNVTLAEAGEIAGAEAVAALEKMSLEIYARARMYASAAGVLIADTKFEFGWIGDRIVLIDEVLTPDSSRFWLASEYRPGSSPPSLDKQYVRDYLDRIGWDHHPPAPELPSDVAARTAERYRMALALLFPHVEIERYMR